MTDLDRLEVLARNTDADIVYEACEEIHKLRELLPREDELDSVMSLLNWSRAKHDSDSATRQWLERVVEQTLALLRGGKK